MWPVIERLLLKHGIFKAKERVNQNGRAWPSEIWPERVHDRRAAFTSAYVLFSHLQGTVLSSGCVEVQQAELHTIVTQLKVANA